MCNNSITTTTSASASAAADSKPQRLQSLDVLRGFDMALLVFIQPIVYTWLETLNPSSGTFAGFLLGQLLHVSWEGFCFWDIIMPLFMFMSGITIPFAMSRYKRGQEQVDRRFWRRVAKRFVVLWLLGMFCQGNLMDFDLHTLKLFSNTLQSIAVGYVVCTLLYVFLSLRMQIAVVAVLFVAYIGVFAVWGNMDFTIGTNVCQQIDNSVLGSMRDGVVWNGDVWTFDPDYNYTWLLSSLNFVVTVFLGCLAGIELRSKHTPVAKAVRLLSGGMLLIVAGLILSPWIPVIKHIWSSSMTLFSGGICMVLMAVFYYAVDIRHWVWGTGWLRTYGVNSLAAYVLAHVSMVCVTDCFFHGFAQWLGAYYGVLQATVGGLLIFAILRWMQRHDIYIKA